MQAPPAPGRTKPSIDRYRDRRKRGQFGKIVRADAQFCNRFVIASVSAYNFTRFDSLATLVSGAANDFRFDPINRPPGRQNDGAL